MERRLDGDLDSGLALETSEYGDRVRTLPRDGDLEGMIAMMLSCEECDRVEREAVRFLEVITCNGR